MPSFHVYSISPDVDLNSHLTAEQKAVGRAFQRLIEDSLYWSVCQLRTEGFLFLHILNEICDILKYGNNLKLEICDYIFRKIIMLNEVDIL